ncbi:hypothetical protein CBR_g1036 [Chara braunii]|uniref:Protein ARV n=1 Tax=Chara braunii TaxID=69332 RepID=A0A388KD30_CHABU|nr:hypothetical protein CBR_g1036 [Chara braunii]|eukprot:GBG67917.1 hypothetical protein CBR_g1036 [Chara braunii]
MFLGRMMGLVTQSPALWRLGEGGGKGADRVEGGGAAEKEAKEGMICVECGSEVQNVYHEYSRGNIRLTRCGTCHQYADAYVEFELVVLVIDLILHKPQAYRHLFFNLLRHDKQKRKALFWKAAILNLVLDSCWGPVLLIGTIQIPVDNLWLFALFASKSLVRAAVRNLVYVAGVLLKEYWQRRAGATHGSVRSRFNWSDAIFALLLSSFFKFFLLPMMVWKFTPKMGVLIHAMILTSNTVALQVVLKSSTLHAATAIMAGVLARFLVNYAFLGFGMRPVGIAFQLLRFFCFRRFPLPSSHLVSSRLLLLLTLYDPNLVPCSVLSRLVSSRLVSSRLVSSRLVSSRQVSSSLVTSRHVSSRLVSSRQVSSRLVSSRLVSSRLVFGL